MSQAVIPDTESKEIAIYALAWEIARTAFTGSSISNDRKVRLREFTNAVIETYRALSSLQTSDK